jgi:predicted nuclease of predicted toxin-antitoxin system
MRLLLDTCISALAKTYLQDAGHDVIWIGDLQEDPGDREIFAWAEREQRVLITLDKDFGELIVRQGQPHHGIVRVVSIRASQQGPVVAEVLSRYSEELKQGAIVTVDSGRVRIRTRPGQL